MLHSGSAPLLTGHYIDITFKWEFFYLLKSRVIPVYTRLRIYLSLYWQYRSLTLSIKYPAHQSKVEDYRTGEGASPPDAASEPHGSFSFLRYIWQTNIVYTTERTFNLNEREEQMNWVQLFLPPEIICKRISSGLADIW